MPDDRFGDLGRQRPERHGPSAAEQLAEMDERELLEKGEQPPPRRPTTRYGWVVGVAFFLVVVVVIVNSARNPGRGTSGPARGEPVPEFAVPTAGGKQDCGGDPCDTNVAQRGATGSTPACEIGRTDVVKVCRGDRRPLVVTFAAKGQRQCVDQMDRVERYRRRLPDVRFVGVLIGEERGPAGRVARERGWGFPVGADRDLAAFNLYRLALCSSVFVDRRGTVTDTRRVPMSDRDFERGLDGIRR